MTVFACIAAGSGCGSSGNEIEGSMRELTNAVEHAGDTGRPFRLSSVTPFEWELVHVFPPYTTPDEISRLLGFDWDAANDSAIHKSDSINLLVFVEHGRVVHAFEQDFGAGNLSCLGPSVVGSGGLRPREAILQVKRESNPTYDLVVPANPHGAREARLIRTCLRNAS